MDYSTLQSRISDWLDQGDLTSEIQGFISDAEAMFNRELIVPEREAQAQSTASTSTIALPADFSAMRSLYVDATPRVVLQYASLFDIHSDYGSLSDTPAWYSIQGSDLLLAPSPASTVSLILNYYQTIPALSDLNTTNWLLTSHPDAYRWAALANAYAYLNDTERCSLAEAKTGQILESIKKSSNRKALGGSPLRPKGPFQASRHFGS